MIKDKGYGEYKVYEGCICSNKDCTLDVSDQCKYCKQGQLEFKILVEAEL